MNKKEAEEYISKLANNFDLTTLSSNLKLKLEKKEKKDKRDNLEEELHIPLVNEYNLFLVTNYSLPELKQICKHYNLKVTGNKSELTKRIYTHLRVTYSIIKLQSFARRFLVKEYLYLYGPAFKNISLCTNSNDFYSMEPLNELHPFQRFSYKDDDGFIYGFDIISLHNLFLKSKDIESVQNPYNRSLIPEYVIKTIKSLIRLSRILKIHINLHYDDDSQSLSIEKSVELRTLTLFQIIDSLGNYSNPQWFLSLNRIQIIKFVRELCDIWNYRSQITNETKRNICPPNGDPFRNLSMPYIHTEGNMSNVKKVVLEVLEKLVNNGIDADSKSLGAYYILGALTLVNENAANAYPWLFQSFNYF
jgi:hypothetical protein